MLLLCVVPLCVLSLSCAVCSSSSKSPSAADACERESGQGPQTFYTLVPAFYSEDGATHLDVAPWLGGDPIGAAVYFSPKHPALQKGTPVRYDVDVESLAAESIAAYNKRYTAYVILSDYVLSEILVGWEIWGGYRTEVEIRDLSLNAQGALMLRKTPFLSKEWQGEVAETRKRLSR